MEAWPDLWQPVPASDAVDRFAGELTRELSPGYPLYSMAIKAVAHRQDNDDVLFRLLDESGQFAVVHLTWRGTAEPPPWPIATFYADETAWRSAAGGSDA